MIRLRIRQPGTAEWKKWRVDAARAAKELARQLRTIGSFTVDEQLYKKMKTVYCDMYHRKCAYCESPLQVDAWDQLDHFRPKNAVRDAENELVQVGVGAGRRDHPGYYWLAYDWTNLVPVCGMCNVRKSARFPLMPGSKYATRPGGEKGEKPVFLHPGLGRENPANHFEYLAKNGYLKPKTERARLMIEILDLNREGLVDERRAAYQACVDLMKDYLDTAKEFDAGRTAAKREVIAKYWAGTAKYSFVGRCALGEMRRMSDVVLRGRGK